MGALKFKKGFVERQLCRRRKIESIYDIMIWLKHNSPLCQKHCKDFPGVTVSKMRRALFPICLLLFSWGSLSGCFALQGEPHRRHHISRLTSDWDPGATVLPSTDLTWFLCGLSFLCFWIQTCYPFS
ncbi:unnamed protein product [Discosporangium mesarthrocarpum]